MCGVFLGYLQISDLQDEMKRKETRWTSSTTRLRDRIEQLEQENGELREELRVIEQKRLEVWQQKEALVNANKVGEMLLCRLTGMT